MFRNAETSLALVFLLLLAAVAHGQVVYVLHKDTTATSDAINMPSATHPMGDDSFLDLTTSAYAGVAAAGAGLLAGGHAIDQKTLTVYSSDGSILQAEPMSHYSLAAAPPAVIIGGTLAGGGPVTGLAVDASAGILWACDGFSVTPLSTTFPYAAVGAAILLTFTAGEEMTGLGFEPSSGTLWGVTPSGVVYNFDTSGALIGGGPSGAVPVSGTPFGGLTVNTTNGAGAFAAPPCSAQLPGYHILVSDEDAVYDALDPAAPAIAVPGSTGGGINGLAFSADAQYLSAGTGACSMMPSPATISLSRPVWVGPSSSPATLDLAGAPPLSTAILLADICAMTPTPVPWPGFLMIDPGTAFVLPVTTSIAGTASVALPTDAAPAGLQFSAQWVYSEPLSAPFPFCHTSTMTVTFGLP